jgi:carbonic anhydrase/acetyltransferase-like protein (isoleucine patch superfamily)
MADHPDAAGSPLAPALTVIPESARGGSAVAESAFIHPTAVVLGDVHLGAESSVWPTAVIRGDMERITIGARSNVQDGAVVHADPGVPTVIGADCVIGHRAIVHGSTLEDGVLVGMGAILLNGVHVERGSVIAAGAVVPEGVRVPTGSLVVGVPGRVVRSLSAARQGEIVQNAARYVALARRYRDGQVARR